MKPCPHCDRTAISCLGSKIWYWCACDLCWLRGPMAKSEEQAKAKWDALPRRVKRVKKAKGA